MTHAHERLSPLKRVHIGEHQAHTIGLLMAQVIEHPLRVTLIGAQDDQRRVKRLLSDDEPRILEPRCMRHTPRWARVREVVTASAGQLCALVDDKQADTHKTPEARDETPRGGHQTRLLSS
uniref:Uncharacterized protein n=1 Tax=uncultured bacterium HF186_75m_14K15 TaxID=662886 RepID=C7FPC9_9BACT|nr:hypothetical protein [uncultured bacterium HF186_75m_14K15]